MCLFLFFCVWFELMFLQLKRPRTSVNVKSPTQEIYNQHVQNTLIGSGKNVLIIPPKINSRANGYIMFTKYSLENRFIFRTRKF